METRLPLNKRGFSLVELMIVVAIISILAAIAVPQFAAYRTRAMNTNAKALNKLIVNTQADLNAELGCYGETENIVGASTLVDAVAPPGAGAIMSSRVEPRYAVAATALIRGGRLSGNNVATDKTFSVPLGIGLNMIALANTPAPLPGTNQSTSYIALAKHLNGDTVYGSDSNVADILYSVSHPGWVGNIAGNDLQATYAAPSTGNNVFDNDNNPATIGDNLPGGGRPTPEWTMVPF